MTAQGQSAALDRGTVQARKALLDTVISLWARQGWRVESRTDTKATIAKGNGAANPLRFLLVVLTFGHLGGIRRRTIAIDQSGRLKQHNGQPGSRSTRSKPKPRLGFKLTRHKVDVHYCPPPDDPIPADPYYTAICRCGWTSPPRPTRQQASDDARAHPRNDKASG